MGAVSIEMDEQRKRRRESTYHNAISPQRIAKLADIDCVSMRVVGRGWAYCDALDWPYCLYEDKPCSFRKPIDERSNNEKK